MKMTAMLTFLHLLRDKLNTWMKPREPYWLVGEDAFPSDDDVPHSFHVLNARQALQNGWTEDRLVRLYGEDITKEAIEAESKNIPY